MKKILVVNYLIWLVFASYGCVRPDPNPLLGRTFVQAGGPGYASYHFDQKNDTYIRYDVVTWKLDNGKPLTPIKPFIHTAFDEENRAFFGVIDWANPEDTSVKDATTWVYMMIFNPDYTSISGGGITSYDINGRYLNHLNYGSDIKYSLETIEASENNLPNE